MPFSLYDTYQLWLTITNAIKANRNLQQQEVQLAYLMYEEVIQMMCKSFSKRQLDLSKSFPLISDGRHSV